MASNSNESAACPDTAESPRLTVYFDGGCPLCTREINYYRKKDAEQRIRWIDASHADERELGADLDRETALGRMHARDSSGNLISGGEAFAAIWQSVPGFQTLGNAFRGGLSGRVLDRLYDFFLNFRPMVQRIYLRYFHRSGQSAD